MLQFEDFQLQYAHTLLQRYKHQHLVFNDDIQVGACAYACISCVAMSFLSCNRLPIQECDSKAEHCNTGPESVTVAQEHSFIYSCPALQLYHQDDHYSNIVINTVNVVDHHG